VVTAADAAAGSVQILGLTGASNGGTELHPHDSEVQIGRAAFFEQVQPGLTVVKVRGRDAGALSGATLTAKASNGRPDRE
jgi:Na+-transporting NADH:ubiquinone oxidoreductase subunit NqrC